MDSHGTHRKINVIIKIQKMIRKQIDLYACFKDRHKITQDELQEIKNYKLVQAPKEESLDNLVFLIFESSTESFGVALEDKKDGTFSLKSSQWVDIYPKIFSGETEMLTEKSWEEFRGTGLILIINQILQVFGWSIVYEFDTETKKAVRAYPARSKYRGFSPATQSDAYKKVSEYMVQHAHFLRNEANN